MLLEANYGVFVGLYCTPISHLVGGFNPSEQLRRSVGIIFHFSESIDIYIYNIYVYICIHTYTCMYILYVWEK